MVANIYFLRSLLFSLLFTLFFLQGLSGPLHAQSYKIMPLGNSITEGSDKSISYRYKLYEKLTNEYYNFNYVGSQTSQEETLPYPLNGKCNNGPFTVPVIAHEGHWGWRADEILNGNPDAASEGKLTEWLQGYTPDVVLMHIGTNDMLQNQSVQETVDELREIIRILRQDNPQVIILLAKLFPAHAPTVGTTAANNIDVLNSNIPALAQELNTVSSPVILVDQNANFDPTPGMDSYDGIHPNERGEQGMADNWFIKLKEVIAPYTTPPLVEITYPEYYSEYTIGQAVTIKVSATDREETVDKVDFYVNCDKIGEDFTSPYEISWTPSRTGNLSLTAEATNASGAKASSQEVYVTVYEAEAGSITREYWADYKGSSVSSIPVGTTPTSVTELSSFEAPSNVASNYGQRVRGYIKAPTTGEYTFWIAADDDAELWLSSSESAADKVKLAFVDGWTNPQEWGKYPSQKSIKILLEGGKRYYIEALHRESWGNDNLAVGWQLPDGVYERPIPGFRLSPITNGSTNNPPVANAGPDKAITLPTSSVTLSGSGTDSDGSISSYSWSQVSGPPAALSGTNTATTTVTGQMEGTYVFRLTVIDNAGASASDDVTLIIYPTPTTACSASGSILREQWNSVSGSSVSDIPLQSSPSATSQLSLFEAPSNIGGNYGARVRGYICPPLTGDYTFFIASDDNSELWLSTDESPTNKQKIASVTGWTYTREWNKYPSQQSAAVRLEAGRRYYIEALHKENWGNDNLAVAWQLPNGKTEAPIPGSRLSPYTTSGTNTPPVANAGPDKAIKLPASSVALSGSGSDSDGSISSYSWSQVSGPNTAAFSSKSTTAPTVTGLVEGNYTFRLTVTDNGGASGSDDVKVTVQPASTSSPIVREFWANVSGTSVAQIPVNTTPTSTSQITLFESPRYTGDNYGARVRAYVHAPATGSYTFWIASDDHSELWLSTDESPANKRKVAYLESHTNSREWTRYASQKSAPITLQAGQKYYIEALHKEGAGSDHLAVGWQLPDGVQERPIPGSRLSPFLASQNATTQLKSSSRLETEDALLTFYPNPFVQEITLQLHGKKDDKYCMQLFDVSGRKVWQSSELEANQKLTLGKDIETGIYILVVSTGKEAKQYKLVKAR